MSYFWALLLALTMTPGVRYTDWRWRYIARTRRQLDDRRCTRCHRRGVMLHVHHRRHVRDGGGYALWNLTTLCLACHELAHGRDLNHDGAIG